MKDNFRQSVLVFTYSIVIGFTVFSQDYQKITGTFLTTTANCECNSLGFLKYTEANGTERRIYLCFDSEPGSYYEIYNNEPITVEGIVQGMSCGTDRKTFWTMYVQKSTLQVQNRRELVPEFIKKQNKNVPVTDRSSSKSKEQVLTGYYTEKGSTKDSWSDCSHCTNCGRLNNNRNQTINFDRINSHPEYHIGNLRVYGYTEGRDFFVTRWELLEN